MYTSVISITLNDLVYNSLSDPFAITGILVKNSVNIIQFR